MDADFKRTFYQHFDSYCRLNNIVAEFTRFHPMLQNHEFSRDNMEVLYNRTTCSVDLRPDYQEIWKNTYSSNNRNMIRRAIKTGVSCETESADIEAFHSMYLKTMSHVNAEDFYFFSMNYFSKLSTLDGFRQIRVDLGGRQVASLILLIYGSYAHYHLAGRDIYQAPPGVANLVLDEAVKYAKNMGCKTLHLGGGSSSFENDGLYRFKCGFSNRKTDFFIGKKVHNYSIYNQLCEYWEKRHPHKKKKFNGLLLKYRKTA